jgi:hypothetical protein
VIIFQKKYYLKRVRIASINGVTSIRNSTVWNTTIIAVTSVITIKWSYTTTRRRAAWRRRAADWLTTLANWLTTLANWLTTFNTTRFATSTVTAFLIVPRITTATHNVF